MKDATRPGSSQRQPPDVSQFYSNIPVGLCSLDLDLRYVHINEWLATINGISVQDHLGRTIGEVLPDVAAGVESQLRQVIETGDSVSGTVEAQTPAQTGIKRLFQHNYLPVKSDDDTIIGVSCVVQDISEQRRVETAVRESDERFDLAVRATSDGLWDWNILTNEEYYTPRWCEILGYSNDDPELPHVYESWASRIHPDDYERVTQAVKAHLETGKVYDVDYRHRHKSGEYRWQNSRGQAIFDKEQKPVRMVGCIRDITERKHAEAVLKSSERQQLRLVIDNVQAFIAHVESSHCYRFVNKRYAEVVECHQHEIIGCHMKDVLGQPAYDTVREHIETALSGELVEFETMLPLKSGKSIWVHATYVPDFAGPYSVQGFYVVSYDITRRKRVEEELDSLRAQLAHVNRLSSMSEMATNLAHEITQPLTAIANEAGTCIELSRQDRLDAIDLQQALQVINEQALRAGKIASRLKHFAVRSAPQRSTLDLNDLVRDVERFLRHDALMRQSQLCCELDKQLPTVQADGIQLQQVLVNLILNAFDATQETEPDSHKVIIRTSAEADEVRVSVCDQGTGLAPEQLECIFEPYFTTKADGLGMGLSISRSIIEAHGGRLRAVPNDDRGMTFYFTLSTAPASVAV